MQPVALFLLGQVSIRNGQSHGKVKRTTLCQNRLKTKRLAVMVSWPRWSSHAPALSAAVYGGNLNAAG